MLARLNRASAQREFEQQLYSDVPTEEAISSLKREGGGAR